MIAFGFPVAFRVEGEPQHRTYHNQLLSNDLSPEEASCVLVFNQILALPARHWTNDRRLDYDWFKQGELTVTITEGYEQKDETGTDWISLSLNVLAKRDNCFNMIKYCQMNISYIIYRSNVSSRFDRKYFVVTASDQKSMERLFVVARLTL